MMTTLLNALASFYFSAIISLLILFSPFYFKRKHDLHSMSGLTTTLGIFGTFIGIFFGLLGFDVNNITASVPQLLGGLKTAFLTSIAGMTAGLILKEYPKFYGIVVKNDDGQELATVETMVKHLAGIEKNQLEIFQKENQQLLNIEKALTGEGETTLITQIQKLRTTLIDKQDELLKAFNEFARNVSENNSKALIDALTQVMKDFNTKINEQFGENFKHLNDAVGKMLEWQKEYAEQVNLMIQQIKTTATAVEQSQKTLTQIVSQANTFSTTAENLQKLITSLEQIRGNIEIHLKAFDEVASNAKNTFPIIDEQLKKLTTDLSKTVERTVSETKTIVNLQLESTQQISKTVQDNQRNINNSLSEMILNLNKNIDKMMKENAERITQQVSQLDKELGNELTKSLQSLGTQLTSLSRRFVDDYSPLTEQLRKVVHMATNNRG